MQNKICLKFKCKLFIICTRRGTRQDPPKKVTTLHCAVDITSVYMLVEFKTFPRKYYVGRITKNKDFEGDYEISCMRKKRNVTEFLPEVTDLASVKEKDIRAVLPAPMECRSTSRQRSSLKFDYDKSGSILMHRHAFAFSFSAHFFVICCCSKLFGWFFYFLENASTNYTVIFCNFDYFNSFFSLSDSALCLIRLCPIHWGLA